MSRAILVLDSGLVGRRTFLWTLRRTVLFSAGRTRLSSTLRGLLTSISLHGLIDWPLLGVNNRRGLFFVGRRLEIRRRFNDSVTFGVCIRNRCAGGGWGDKKSVRVVADTGLLPGESAQGHATEDDGQRPDVSGAGIVFLFIVHLRSQIRIRADDSCHALEGGSPIWHCQSAERDLPEAGTMSFSKGYRKTTALPKSISFMMPCSLTTTLSNFRSRWARPIPCK